MSRARQWRPAAGAGAYKLLSVRALRTPCGLVGAAAAVCRPDLPRGWRRQRRTGAGAGAGRCRRRPGVAERALSAQPCRAVRASGRRRWYTVLRYVTNQGVTLPVLPARAGVVGCGGSAALPVLLERRPPRLAPNPSGAAAAAAHGQPDNVVGRCGRRPGLAERGVIRGVWPGRARYRLAAAGPVGGYGAVVTRGPERTGAGRPGPGLPARSRDIGTATLCVPEGRGHGAEASAPERPWTRRSEATRAAKAECRCAQPGRGPTGRRPGPTLRIPKLLPHGACNPRKERQQRRPGRRRGGDGGGGQRFMARRVETLARSWKKRG
jgi:hypothetical protein